MYERAATAAPTRGTPAPAARTAGTPPAQTAAQQQAAETRAFTQQVERFNQQRENLLPKTGTTSTQVSNKEIETAPGGANQSVSDILVSQFPAVSQDSTSSGDYHVRNDHANVQFRINGILLPDGVSGFAWTEMAGNKERWGETSRKAHTNSVAQSVNDVMA